ncbi:hypothetical protein H696_01635 [Fonticula alba]|uniref:Uncharacterized protein n=1 Tax=Fonticula alba TaxID=691883 RepID=A0A058ZCX5_FONAL|nr:hypothetical protein H696_01635 [Fonticula alba]KCV72234.1 hypothetical protein H696_01635 [Fonticula alba]|eukprot:XP_009493812.1 hypothetical protein H696_01635 [Fonticula alba]
MAFARSVRTMQLMHVYQRQMLVVTPRVTLTQSSNELFYPSAEGFDTSAALAPIEQDRQHSRAAAAAASLARPGGYYASSISTAEPADSIARIITSFSLSPESAEAPAAGPAPATASPAAEPAWSAVPATGPMRVPSATDLNAAAMSAVVSSSSSGSLPDLAARAPVHQAAVAVVDSTLRLLNTLSTSVARTVQGVVQVLAGSHNEADSHSTSTAPRSPTTGAEFVAGAAPAASRNVPASEPSSGPDMALIAPLVGLGLVAALGLYLCPSTAGGRRLPLLVHALVRNHFPSFGLSSSGGLGRLLSSIGRGLCPRGATAA